MNKISKVLVMMVVILAVVTLSLKVEAVSNADLISYLKSEHTILGTKYNLNDSQKKAMEEYLTANPVDDATAASIKADLVEAINQLNATGATGLDKVSSDVKSKVTTLIKSAGTKAGLTVEVNTGAKTIAVKDSTGKSLFSTSYSSAIASTATSQTVSGTLVYTGTSYAVGLSVLAIIAVATVLILRRKV